VNKKRALLVGCGGISDVWLAAVKKRDDLEIVGLVDLRREAAEKRAAEHGLATAAIGDNLENLLQTTRPDLVFDCTLPEAHVAVVTAALRQGCHVLGEKPLADTMPRAREVVATAKQTGRIYAVMQNRRYMANIQALRRFLDGGALGRITTVYCDFFIGAHFGGFREKMPHVLLLDMAIHTFDQARFLTRQDALAALAHEWNPPGSWYARDASAVVTFEMSGEVVYNYRGSWCAEGFETPWEASWRIIGEKGTVTWDGADLFRAQVVTGGTGFRRELADVAVPYDKSIPMLSGHAGCIDEFMRCLQTGKTPQTVCQDNIKSLAMVHAAIESAANGRRVEIAPT
jgi:predicted dehydrogenase